MKNKTNITNENSNKRVISCTTKFILTSTLIFFSYVTNGCNTTFTDSVSNCIAYFTPTVNGSAPYAYFWDFGNGNTSTLSNPSNTYNDDGPYFVTLIVTDNSGCISTFTKSILITGCFPSGYSYYGFTNSLCTFQFTDLSVCGPGSDYHWDFGDGDTSNVPSPSHHYQLSGSYTVCLTIADFANVCGYTWCESITVNCEQTGFAPFVNTMSETIVYPNPSSNIFTLKLGNEITASEIQVCIFNMLGEQVSEIKTIGSKSIKIDLSEHTAGIYNCQLNNNGKVKRNYKLIKQQ